METINYFICGSIVVTFLFILYRSFFIKVHASLPDCILLFLAGIAACTSMELIYFVIEGSKKLGDFQSNKIIIIVGALALIWISFHTIIKLGKTSPVDKPKKENSSESSKSEPSESSPQN